MITIIAILKFDKHVILFFCNNCKFLKSHLNLNTQNCSLHGRRFRDLRKVN